MKRQQFGLTDYERAAQDENRRTRNCMIGIVALWLLVAWISYPN